MTQHIAAMGGRCLVRAFRRSTLVFALTFVLVLSFAGTAAAETVRLSSAERARLAAFLTAFTRSNVRDFSTTRGVSDAALIQFGTRELWWKEQMTPVDGIHFAIDADAVDQLALKYFGRRPLNRNAHSTITYADGRYLVQPYDVPAPRARLVKVTSTRKGYWTVTYNKYGWDGSSDRDMNLNQCVAQLRVTSRSRSKYTLRGLRTTKFKIPDFRGSYFYDAEDSLKSRGFRYRSIPVYAGDGGRTTDGTVYQQSPRANTLAPKGSTVTIWWGYEHS